MMMTLLIGVLGFLVLGGLGFALAGGESGNMASPYYGDLLESWRDGNYFAAPVAAQAAHQLTLQPVK